jgi:hypothetical protein
MAYTINSISLGNVSKENHHVTSDLDTEAYPLSGSKDMEAIDAGNVLRRITIEGRVVDTSKDNIMNNFVQPVDALHNGDQQAVIFHSDIWDLTTSGNYTNGNFNVKVDSFDWDYEEGSECAVTYTLVLIESI